MPAFKPVNNPARALDSRSSVSQGDSRKRSIHSHSTILSSIRGKMMSPFARHLKKKRSLSSTKQEIIHIKNPTRIAPADATGITGPSSENPSSQNLTTLLSKVTQFIKHPGSPSDAQKIISQFFELNYELYQYTGLTNLISKEKLNQMAMELWKVPAAFEIQARKETDAYFKREDYTTLYFSDDQGEERSAGILAKLEKKIIYDLNFQEVSPASGVLISKIAVPTKDKEEIIKKLLSLPSIYSIADFNQDILYISNKGEVRQSTHGLDFYPGLRCPKNIRTLGDINKKEVIFQAKLPTTQPETIRDNKGRIKPDRHPSLNYATTFSSKKRHKEKANSHTLSLPHARR